MAATDPPPSDPGADPSPPLSKVSHMFGLSTLRDTVIIIGIAVFGLTAGAGFFVPLVLALLTYVLIIAVSDTITGASVGGHRPPRWIADLAAILLVLSGLFAVMFILGSQATQFARALPSYEAQFDAALGRVVSLIGNELTKVLQDTLVNIDLSRLARSAFGGATSFLNTFLLICLYVGFLMAERKIMAHKVLLAAGDPRIGADLSRLMGEISTSLQRYVGVKTFVSVLTAVFSYTVFQVLGLEYPETWAVLTFSLNFIPSIGSVVAVVFPAMVALVQFETITPFLVIVLGCGVVQFLIGNFLDPALLGRSLNLSTFMVILALTFWTAVWGLIGAFLSVPLTVCVMIVFSKIPMMRPVAVMMSKDGRLLQNT